MAAEVNRTQVGRVLDIFIDDFEDRGGINELIQIQILRASAEFYNLAYDQNNSTWVVAKNGINPTYITTDELRRHISTAENKIKKISKHKFDLRGGHQWRDYSVSE